MRKRSIPPTEDRPLARVPLLLSSALLRLPARRAFSIIEMVMVLVILAILLAIAQPRFAGVLERNRVQQAANRVAMDLRLAQSEAIRRAGNVTVQYDVAADRYTITYGGTAIPSPDRPGQPYVIHLAEDPYRADLSAANFGGAAQVVFDRYGAANATGVVTVVIGVWRIDVTVQSSTGAVTVGPLTRQIAVS